MVILEFLEIATPDQVLGVDMCAVRQLDALARAQSGCEPPFRSLIASLAQEDDIVL